MIPTRFLEGLFWLCVGGSGFSYVLYPALLSLARTRVVNRNEAAPLPRMSVIIAARNEAKRIVSKIESTLALDYPLDRLEVIVASDASDDNTDALVAAYSDRGVRLARTPKRGGKEAAQAHAIKQSNGDILVFTDSATRLDADALRRIAFNFTDAGVGAVSSEDRLEVSGAEPTISGEGAYVRYEMWLRRLESDRAGLVGLSGSLFAVRREVAADDWPTAVPSDITAALLTAEKGFRAVADPLLFGHYADLQNPQNEYERKVRTVVRGMAAVGERRGLLNPIRHGLFAFELWGHKVMRWLTPVFLIFVYLLSGLLVLRGVVYGVIFAVQTAFYLAVLLAWLMPSLRRFKPIKLAYYLFQVHLALLHAGVRYLRGERIVVWNPSVR